MLIMGQKTKCSKLGFPYPKKEKWKNLRNRKATNSPNLKGTGSEEWLLTQVVRSVGSYLPVGVRTLSTSHLPACAGFFPICVGIFSIWVGCPPMYLWALFCVLAPLTELPKKTKKKKKKQLDHIEYVIPRY